MTDPAIADCFAHGCFGPAVQREANQLVEEFMLLANMSVAKMIADAFPERALLRRHPPPDERKIGDLTQLANDLVSCPSALLQCTTTVVYCLAEVASSSSSALRAAAVCLVIIHDF